MTVTPKSRLVARKKTIRFVRAPFPVRPINPNADPRTDVFFIQPSLMRAGLSLAGYPCVKQVRWSSFPETPNELGADRDRRTFGAKVKFRVCYRKRRRCNDIIG